jgi:FTR1 family protein
VLQSLIIALREGIEAALVVGLTLSYLQRTGRRDLRGAVFAGVGLAVLGSVLGALALSLLRLSEELVEGVLMLVAAIFVGTTLAWMHRASRRLSADIRSKVDQAVGGGGAWALGLFVFFMIVREGAEMVLFLAAVSLSSSGLLTLVGTALGLALAVAFAVAFFRGALELDLKRFFGVTTFILAVLVVELLLHAYHEFSEIGILPATHLTMAVVGPAVKNSVLFIMALVLAPIVALIVPGSKPPVPADAPAAELDGPEARLRRAAIARRHRWVLIYVAGILVVGGLLLADWVAGRRALVLPASTAVKLDDGAVRLDAASLSADTQHRYVVDVAGTPVRFFVWKIGHEPRVALDACEICGPIGYVQQQRQLICVNCGAEIYPPSLGQQGGCNPIPLPFEMDGATLVIRQKSLEAAAPTFQAPAR